jgi:thiol:disulfide interchange protein DsbD
MSNPTWGNEHTMIVSWPTRTLAALAFGAAIAIPGPTFGGPQDPPAEGAAPPPPIAVRTEVGQSGVLAGGTLDFAAILTIAPSWHVNSNRPNEEWLIPTEVWLDDSTTVRAEAVAWPTSHEIRLSFSEVPMAVFEGQAVVGVRVRAPESLPGGVFEFSGGIGYQACNDETCLAPERVPFTISVPVVGSGASIERRTTGAFAGLRFPEPDPGRSPGSTGSPAPGPRTTGSSDAGGPSAGTGDSAVAETPLPGNTTGAPIPVEPRETAGAPRDEPKGFQEKLGGVLASNFGNPIVAIALTLLLGLLSAATPCVYPMIPITVRILMGRGAGSTARGRTHAFLYFAGIIAVYAVLGFIAGATGGGFNQIMRIPIVILAFAILFAFLGLSMFGLFEIQIPSSIASRVDASVSSRSGYLGTMLMGVGAGLVVSPCVGPVVVFILSQIASQIATAKAAGAGALSSAGPLAYGSFLMAGYGAGLGVPFLLVGLFSTRGMAKPGSWMTIVRMVLGALILYFAYDYFLKAMDTAGVARPLSNSIARGVVMIFLAVYWGVFRTRIEDGPHAGWQHVRLASTIILLIVGTFFLWTGLTRSGLVPLDTSHAPPTTSSPRAGSPSVEDSHGLLWQRDYERAAGDAATRKLPLFVDFYANWCANCKVFSAQAAQAGPLREALESVVRVKVYDTDAVFERFRSDPRYAELKVGLPFFAILSSRGELLWKGVDYRAHDTFIRELDRAKERERTPAS